MRIINSLLLVIVTLMVADLAFGQTWTPTSSPSEGWGTFASSADGNRVIAEFFQIAGVQSLLVSTNGGANWATNNSPTSGSDVDLNSIVLSADGMEIVGVAGTTCWVSTDFGNTWSSNNVPGATVLSSVAMSADGTKMVAVSGQGGSSQSVNGPICISTNSGTTWTQTMAPTNDWVSVASSTDGSKLVAAVHNNDEFSPSGNFIYISTNSGASWILSGAPTNIPWWSVASSADGRKVVAASALVFTDPKMFGSVYTSTNFGMTWKSNNVPAANWLGVASSADGTTLVAGGQSQITTNSFIYTSTNSGASWVSNNAPNILYWGHFVSSADGCKMFGVPLVNQTNIFTFQTRPTPHLNIANSASNLALSWLIPSTNFVLQQSPDLVSWAAVTNAPALNFTNLQNQVTLPPSNSSGFYRLKSP